MKKILMIGLLVLIFPFLIHANYLEKAKIEENFQGKIQHILDTMYGKNLFSVTATVLIGKETWTVDYTDRAKIDFQDKKGLPSEKYNILPGYSAIRNLSPNEAVQMPFNSKITKNPSKIIKVTLDIITSKKLSKRDVKASSKIINDILGLNIERGDSVNFVFQSFPVHKGSEEEVQIGLPIEAKLMIIVLVITSLFLIVYIVLKIKQLNLSKASIDAQKETAKSLASSSSNAPAEATKKEEPMAVSQSTSTDAQVGYFSFVNANNIQQFKSIILKDDLPADQLSIVVSFLNPLMSKVVLDSLESAKLIEVIKGLADEKIVEKETLDTLNSDLKSKLECSVGGAPKLSPIISEFNDKVKKELLSSVESNPELYKAIRPDILLFEDIGKLEDSEVKKLIGALNMEVLSAAVAKDTSESSNKIKNNLTGAAKAMVTQFVELKKDQLTDQTIIDSQQKVVLTMKLLNDSGSIDIGSKLTN